MKKYDKGGEKSRFKSWVSYLISLSLFSVL